MAAVTCCKCAYKLQIASVHGTTFMLQYAYGCCSLEIGKYGYKLQIAIIDGAMIMRQFTYGFSKLCSRQMSIQISKCINRWYYFSVAFSIWKWNEKRFAKGFLSPICKEKKIQISYVCLHAPLHRHGQTYRINDLCRPSFRAARNKPCGWETEK